MKVGPYNTYPEHAHAADEAYHILAGEIFQGLALAMNLGCDKMLVIYKTMIKDRDSTSLLFFQQVRLGPAKMILEWFTGEQVCIA